MTTRKSRITHVIDKGADKGALVIIERTLFDAAGKLLATLEQTTFCRGDGGFGEGDASPTPLPAAPNRPADRQCTFSTPTNAALL